MNSDFSIDRDTKMAVSLSPSIHVYIITLFCVKLFADNCVDYAGQAVGIIVAGTYSYIKVCIQYISLCVLL